MHLLQAIAGSRSQWTHPLTAYGCFYELLKENDGTYKENPQNCNLWYKNTKILLFGRNGWGQSHLMSGPWGHPPSLLGVWLPGLRARLARCGAAGDLRERAGRTQWGPSPPPVHPVSGFKLRLWLLGSQSIYIAAASQLCPCLAADPDDACTDPDPWTTFPAWPWTCLITHGIAWWRGLQTVPDCPLPACPAPSMRAAGWALTGEAMPSQPADHPWLTATCLLALYLTPLLCHTNVCSPLWGLICHDQVVDPVCDPLTIEHGVGDDRFVFCASMYTTF